MHKHLAGWGIALLTFAGILLPFSQAIALTPEQIQAIVTLVRSFGGDDATLRNVEDSLFGRTPSSSNNTTASRSCVTFSRNFGIGSTGDDVNALQSLLGQQKGDKGVFGEETASLVVDFQGKYGINQTGYVGPTTRAQLNVLGCSEGLSDARMRARDARRVADIKQLQVALELFYDAKGSYPASLSELGTSIISVVPKDPTGNQYSYKALPEGCSSSGKKCTNYHIGASLEGSDAQSLKGDSDSDTSGLVGGFSGADTQPCGGKGAGYCFDITGYVGPVLIPPVPFVSEPYVTVSNASALLGAPIPNSSGLTVGYYYTMAFTLSNKGTSAVYLSNMGRGTDITAVLTPDASSVSYSRDASPVSLSGDMSGVSLIIPAGSTRTLRFSGQLQSEGQTGQVSYQITSLIYGASASNPTGHSVTSGLSNLKISANFGSSSSKPTLTVLSPNGGETYQAGSRVLVRWAWSPSYLGSAVNIGLIGPVMSDTYVTSNWGNVGNFEWVVPSNITLGSYKLKIGAVPGDQILAGAYDESNGYFTITSASSVSRRDTITSYYRELLLREPDLAGLDYWDKGNTPLDTIKAGILSSYEYGVKKQINSLYQELLGRTAEKEGMEYWYTKIYVYQWTLSQVRDGIMASEEYRNKKGGVVTFSCKDSDGGRNPDFAGLTDGRVNGIGSYFNDASVTSSGGVCSGDSCTAVAEGYCTSDGKVTNILTQCSTGYSVNGACAPKSVKITEVWSADGVYTSSIGIFQYLDWTQSRTNSSLFLGKTTNHPVSAPSVQVGYTISGESTVNYYASNLKFSSADSASFFLSSYIADANATPYGIAYLVSDSNFLGTIWRTGSNILFLHANLNSPKGRIFLDEAYAVYAKRFVPEATAVFTATTENFKPLVCGMYGDFNGDSKISATDVDLLRAHILGTTVLAEKFLAVADVNKDGNVSTLDVAYINGYLAGTQTTFPVCTVATPSSLSLVLNTTVEDRAGVWGTFKAGVGNTNKSPDDWNWTATLSVPSSKTIKSIKMDHNVVSEHWSTDNTSDYPLVIVEGGAQLNYASGQTIIADGNQTFRLFGQKESAVSYGFMVTVTFTDGTSVSANAQ